MLRRVTFLESLLHHRCRSSRSNLGVIRLLVALPPATEEEDEDSYDDGCSDSTSDCSTNNGTTA
jgi:hypothetical protein